MKRRGVLALLVVVVANSASEAIAALTLDQSYAPAAIDRITPIYAPPPGSNGIELAQTFTAGMSGQLVRVDLAWNQFLVPSAPLLVEIRATDRLGFPTEANVGAGVLGVVEIPPGALPAGAPDPQPDPFYAVDLSALGIDVAAGDLLAIVLRSFTDGTRGQYAWDGTLADRYPGGAAFFRLGGTWIEGLPDSVADHPFRTYVEPAPAVPVPSPTSWAAWVALAAAAASLFRRRRG